MARSRKRGEGATGIKAFYVIPLKEFIEETSEEIASGVFSHFECVRDPDIADFLIHKAIPFEKTNRSRTYLILDENAIYSDNQLVLLGYCSVSLQVLKIPEGASKSQIKKLDGLYTRNRSGDGPITEIPAYLIGQIGKNDRFTNALAGSTILEVALAAIGKAKESVGGRVVFIECRPIPQLIQFYKQNGFTYLQEDPTDKMHQMYIVI